jgi:hypothetical protein
MSLTKGMQIENEIAKRKLAGVHGDLDAIRLIQVKLTLGLVRDGRIGGITFEGKKHLWNMISRLTSRVESAILSDRDLLREVIHLAAKGRRV